MTEKAHNVKGLQNQWFAPLNFKLSNYRKAVFSHLNLSEMCNHVTEKQAVVLTFPRKKEKKFTSSQDLTVLCLTLCRQCEQRMMLLLTLQSGSLLTQRISLDLDHSWEIQKHVCISSLVQIGKQIAHPIYCTRILSVKWSWSTQTGSPSDETRSWGPARHLLYTSHWAFCVGAKWELVWSKTLKMRTGRPSAPLHPLFRSIDPLQLRCATC